MRAELEPRLYKHFEIGRLIALRKGGIQ